MGRIEQERAAALRRLDGLERGIECVFDFRHRARGFLRHGPVQSPNVRLPLLSIGGELAKVLTQVLGKIPAKISVMTTYVAVIASAFTSCLPAIPLMDGRGTGG